MKNYYISLFCLAGGAFNIGLGLVDNTWWAIAIGIFACLVPFLNHLSLCEEDLDIIRRNSYK